MQEVRSVQGVRPDPGSLRKTDVPDCYQRPVMAPVNRVARPMSE